jgi:hypothetical protein
LAVPRKRGIAAEQRKLETSLAQSRVPDAVQRSLRCTAEPGPTGFRWENRLLLEKMGPGSAAHHFVLRSVRDTYPNKRKREGLRSPPLSVPVFAAQGAGDIPTPPRAMTKLFDATCVATSPARKHFP